MSTTVNRYRSTSMEQTTMAITRTAGVNSLRDILANNINKIHYVVMLAVHKLLLVNWFLLFSTESCIRTIFLYISRVWWGMDPTCITTLTCLRCVWWTNTVLPPIVYSDGKTDASKKRGK